MGDAGRQCGGRHSGIARRLFKRALCCSTVRVGRIVHEAGAAQRASAALQICSRLAAGSSLLCSQPAP